MPARYHIVVSLCLAWQVAAGCGRPPTTPDPDTPVPSADSTSSEFSAVETPVPSAAESAVTDVPTTTGATPASQLPSTTSVAPPASPTFTITDAATGDTVINMQSDPDQEGFALLEANGATAFALSGEGDLVDLRTGWIANADPPDAAFPAQAILFDSQDAIDANAFHKLTCVIAEGTRELRCDDTDFCMIEGGQLYLCPGEDQEDYTKLVLTAV